MPRLEALRRPRQQRQKVRKQHIPFTRLSAKIMVDSSKAVANCRVFLNDLSPEGVNCFADVSVGKGEIVSIVVEQPKHLFVKGLVLWCSPILTTAKVLSKESYKYRVGVKFRFTDDEEREALTKYCQELRSQPGPG